MKELLRLSMATLTRFLHTAPSGGWTFRPTYFPPATDVGRSSFQHHYDPFIFTGPKAFIPERWLEEDSEVKESMGKHWFAFGAGSRACIARNLAMTELYIVHGD